MFIIDYLLKGLEEIFAERNRVFWIIVTCIVSGIVGGFLKELLVDPMAKGTKKYSLKLFSLIWKAFRNSYLFIFDIIKNGRKRRRYGKIIKRIEKGKMGIPDDFLWGKNPKSNPELKRIFEMIEEGLLPKPKGYDVYKLLENVDIDSILKSKSLIPPHNIHIPKFDHEIFNKK
ncbi:hypothetical protein D3C76_404620 [compost metagenome]